MPIDGWVAAVATWRSAWRAVPVDVNVLVAVVVPDCQATAKSPLKLAATDARVCSPVRVAFAVRRDRLTAPFVRASRTSPTSYDALASASSSQTTTASPEAETA